MLTSIIVPIVIVGVALIIWLVLERFSPDPLLTQIVKIILFVVVLVVLVMKLLPLIGV